MKKIKGNEDFLCINQCVNIFDIVSCKEEQASQIIAWLLNPREAHGLGNKTICKLLESIADDNATVRGYKGNKESNIPIKDILKSYQDVVIQTEYPIRAEMVTLSDANRRIDILLCIEGSKENKYLIVIENKYGAKEHQEQTKAYFNYFSDEEFGKYSCVYIYMDIYDYYIGNEKISGNKDEAHWHLINYDWLTKFLKENMYRRTPVDSILKDVYIEFSGDDEEEGYFSAFFNQKQKLLQSYKHCKGSDRYKIGEDNDVDTYNYTNFYKALNNCSVFEEFIPLQNNKCYLNEKEYTYHTKPSYMYIIPTNICNEWYQKWYVSKQKGDWPISCGLYYCQNTQTITAKIEIYYNNLDCFINKNDLIKQIEKYSQNKNDIFVRKKRVSVSQTLSCLDKKDKLIKFLEKYDELFEIIKKGKYKK